MLNAITIVLCQTSHPGNIGAAARAMKNMGLSQLCLVNPKQFPHPEATQRASGATAVLENAQVVSSLQEAVHGCHWVLGTSARSRFLPWPNLSPSSAAEKIIQHAAEKQNIALVFGSEQSGLTNEELQCCDYHITIPTAAEYSSLNLACAVQVIVYEIYVRYQTAAGLVENSPISKATAEQKEALLQHLADTAIKLDFLLPYHPKKLLPRVKRLLAKMRLESEEVALLRGFLSAIHRKLNRL